MSGDKMRVPMKRSGRGSNWLGEDNVAVRLEPSLTGRRFSMDVSEMMLAQIGARGLEACVEKLGQHVAYEHLHEIQAAADRYLLDGSWARPIIEDELRRAVREFVLTLWSDEEKQNLRDWFELFVMKVRGEQPAQTVTSAGPVSADTP